MAIPLESLSYTALNLHTANRSLSSLCGIGILVVECGKEIYRDFILVKPKTKYFSKAKYGYFTEEKLQSAPTLKEVWPRVLPYINEKNVVFYNSEKSLSIICESLKIYNIELPDFPYVDIRDMFNINNALGFSYAGLASTCGYSKDFQTGNVMENLNLYKACIEYGAKRSNTILQKVFGVKSIKTKRTSKNKVQELPPEEQSKPSFLESLESQAKADEERRARMTPEEREKEDKENQRGCLIFIVAVVLAVAWYFLK